MEKKGITIGGLPLTDYLKEKEKKEQELKEAELAESVMEHVQMEIRTHKRTRPPKTTAQYANDIVTSRGTPRVSKRVRRLTDEEIRKEYGVESKRYNVLAKNVIYLLKERGSVSSHEVAEILGVKTATAGTQLWRFSQAFGDKAIEIDKTQSPNVYSITPTFRRKTVEELYEMYLTYNRTKYAEAQAKKLKKEPPEPKKKPEKEVKPDDKEEIEIDFEAGDKLYHAMVDAVVKKLEDRLQGRLPASNTVDINVNVTLGFKWLR